MISEIARQKRRNAVLEARLHGKSHIKIAKEIGMSRTTVANDLKHLGGELGIADFHKETQHKIMEDFRKLIGVAGSTYEDKDKGTMLKDGSTAMRGLENIAKIIGAYEKDNTQKKSDVVVNNISSEELIKLAYGTDNDEGGESGASEA